MKKHPRSVNPALEAALRHHKAGQLKQAEAQYLQALKHAPANSTALEFLGKLYLQTDRPQEAAKHLQTLSNQGSASLSATIDHARALILSQQFDPAQALLASGARLHPDSAEVYYLLGQTFTAQKNHAAAIDAYSHALTNDDRHLRALEYRAMALATLRRHQEAIQDCEQALTLKPDSTSLHRLKGVSHSACQEWADASNAFMAAIQIGPASASDHMNLGHCLCQLKLFSAATRAYRRALMANPDHAAVMSSIVRSRHESCEWEHYEADNRYLTELILEQKTVENPFTFLNISESGVEQLACANAWTQHHLKNFPPRSTPRPKARARIRIAYVSADYYTHATAILAEQLFKMHDRSSFEIIGISLNTVSNDATTDRLRHYFDAYHEVAEQGSEQIAALIRALDIDILIDLKGYTKDARPDIFAHHPAPVQVSYLGFPGTMGGDLMDYIIGDATVTPPGHEAFYSEKVVRLPGSYQINDNQRPIPQALDTRAEHGLPEQGFVFCCFNNNYKITPSVFAIWMRLLRQVDGSVLWLLQDNEDAARNLRAEATRHGVDPSRLVFAGRLPVSHHLARHRHADLFLDTRPYNAHTTTSDALWAGLPVLTCPGEAFAARVAASLLGAAGLPELIAADYLEYERLALELATEPHKLATIKDKLERQRMSCDLFDTEKTTRALEAAYRAMYARLQSGLPPDHIDVQLPI